MMPRPKLFFEKLLLLVYFLDCYNFLQNSLATPEDPKLTFEHLYQYGKNEYTSENWSDCVAFLLRAIDDFNYFREENLWCTRNCDKRLKRDLAKIVPANWDADTWFTANVMAVEAQKALCFLKCRNEKFTDQRPPISNFEFYEQFLERRPYHYLQFCYWKLGDLRNAVKNAYTFLIGNPTHEDTLDNLNFYMEQPGFSHDMLLDSLQPSFERVYMDAVGAYNDGNWHKCTEKFEESLDAFFEKLEECRMQCDDSLDWGSLDQPNPTISIVFTSFYTSVLRCRQKCLPSLSKINGRSMPNFLASYFEYLHVCQYKTNHGWDASQSVANALLLNPKDIVMRRNKMFYLQTYKQPELFKPSQAIEAFYIGTEVEKNFLNFVDEKFRYASGTHQFQPSDPTDFASLDPQVNLADAFDYSKLQRPLLDEKECKALELSSVFYPKVLRRETRLLIDELRQRIADQYEGDLPEFKDLACVPENSQFGKTGCDRAPFVVGINEKNCAVIFGETFDGCAIVFCA